MLRQWPQLALLSLLLPGWIGVRIVDAVDRYSSTNAHDWAAVPLAAEALLAALTYLSARHCPPLGRC